MNETTEFPIPGTKPAAMPAGLQNRLLAAMQEAAGEEKECRETELLLKRFQPAPLSMRLAGHLSAAAGIASQQSRTQSRGYAGWQRGAVAAAAALLLFAAGGSLLMPGSAVAQGENQGLVSRNIIDSRSMGQVEWRRGEAPVRHYQVIYEDAFVLDSDGTTTVIRVPNQAEVEVEEDYL